MTPDKRRRSFEDLGHFVVTILYTVVLGGILLLFAMGSIH